MIEATVLERIRSVDSQLLVAGERMARYRRTGPPSSCIVQMGVIDRMLDRRLHLMRERDHKPAVS